jgi:hypothetical protein
MPDLDELMANAWPLLRNPVMGLGGTDGVLV